MLDIGAIDINRIAKTAQTGGVDAGGIKEQALKENALFEFGANKNDLSSKEMEKLEEDFLSAANGAGMSNPFDKKPAGTDNMQSEKESNIDAIKSLAKEIQTLVQNTQSLISNLSKNQENGNTGIQIGNNNENKDSKINIFEQHSEATTKQQEASAKNDELGALLKETESLDIQIASQSTCGEQGEVPDIKEETQKTQQVEKNSSESKNAEDNPNTQNEIAHKQIDLLSRLFPEMDAKTSDEIGEYKDAHNKNILDLNLCLEMLGTNKNNLPSSNSNGSYTQKQKALFLGLSS